MRVEHVCLLEWKGFTEELLEVKMWTFIFLSSWGVDCIRYN